MLVIIWKVKTLKKTKKKIIHEIWVWERMIICIFCGVSLFYNSTSMHLHNYKTNVTMGLVQFVTPVAWPYLRDPTSFEFQNHQNLLTGIMIF